MEVLNNSKINSFLPEISIKQIEEEPEEPTVNDIMAVEEDTELPTEEVKEEEEEEEDLPTIKMRERVDTDEVFTKHQKQQYEEEPSHSLKVKKTKRVMSQQQKDNLKKAREKAALNRKLRKEALEQGEEPILTVKEKKKKKQLEEIAQKIPQTVNITNNFTKDDIEEISNRASSKAILRYDEERKIRKADKQKRLKKETEQKKIQNTIRQATGRRAYGSEGFFEDCF